MIQTQYDAKRLIAEMHNSILKSLEEKDTEIRRQAINMLRDLFEEKNYSITYEFSDEIGFEATQLLPSDWSSTGKRHHEITRIMTFFWLYGDDYEGDTEGDTITAHIIRRETYHTHDGYYHEHRSFFIDWNVNLQKWTHINRSSNKSSFTPRG